METGARKVSYSPPREEWDGVTPVARTPVTRRALQRSRSDGLSPRFASFSFLWK